MSRRPSRVKSTRAGNALGGLSRVWAKEACRTCSTGDLAQCRHRARGTWCNGVGSLAGTLVPCRAQGAASPSRGTVFAGGTFTISGPIRGGAFPPSRTLCAIFLSSQGIPANGAHQQLDTIGGASIARRAVRAHSRRPQGVGASITGDRTVHSAVGTPTSSGTGGTRGRPCQRKVPRGTGNRTHVNVGALGACGALCA